jgi:hypothetical protein
MPAATANVFLRGDLEDVSRTGQLADSDLRTLRTVADWIKTFLTRRLTSTSAALCPRVPSCPWPWSARHFGSLLSTSPTEAHHRLPNS